MSLNYSETEPRTLGGLTDYFRDLFGLHPSDLSEPHLHEAIHVMTGFGIGIADELRVDIYQGVMDGGRDMGPLRVKFLFDASRRFIAGQSYLGAKHSFLETGAWRQAQLETEIICRAEQKEHERLAVRILSKFMDVAGRPMSWATLDDLKKIEASRLDFTAEAQAIKSKYCRSKAERMLERDAAKAFDAASMELRGQHMPRPFKPWWGPGASFFTGKKA